MTADLDWVPTPLRGRAELVGSSTLRVTLTPDCQEVELDRVPAGWRIEIDAARALQWPFTIDVNAPAQGVVWILKSLGSKPVTLGSKLRSVQIKQPRQSVQVKLTGNQTNFVLDSGKYTIDNANEDEGNSVSYNARASQPDATVSLGGTARLRNLHGYGATTFRSDVRIQKINIEGSLNVEGTLKVEKQSRVKYSLTCWALSANYIEADVVTVRAKNNAQVPANIALGTGISARQVDVAGPLHAVDSTPAELTIQESLAVTDLTNIAVTAADSSTIKASSARQCSFSGSIQAIELGSAAKDLYIRDTISLIASSCEGFVDIDARMASIGVIRGEGRIAGDVIKVDRNVTGHGGPLTLVARHNLTVVGSASDAILICDASTDEPALTIGIAKSNQLTLSSPDVSIDVIHPVRVQQTNTSTHSVTNCVIIANGSARIAPNVVSSVLRICGRLELGGGLDSTELTIGTLSIPDEIQQKLGISPERTPCDTQEFAADGKVTLNTDQQIKSSSIFATGELHGGSVVLDDEDGLFAARIVRQSHVTAGIIGVIESPTGSTFTAGKLMRCDNIVPDGNVLNLSGDGAFVGSVGAKLSWQPNGYRTCNIHAGAEVVDVTTNHDAGHDNVCRLRLGENHKIASLALSGTLRLELLQNNRSQQSSRAKSDPSPIFTRLALGTCAHFDMPEGKFDLGHIQLTADATLSQNASTTSELVLRVAARHNKDFEPTLTVTPGNLARLEEPLHSDDDTSSKPHGFRVRFTRGIAVVTYAVRNVDCDPESLNDVDAPQLQIETQGSVESLSGRFRLKKLRGRISCGREPAKLLRVTAPEHPTRNRQPDRAEPYDDLAGGQLVGVDVTRLPFTDIPALSHVHVFDPDGKSLMDHAKGDGDHAKAQERAQRLKLLADAVANKATSGATRSAVMWASARAHHASVRRKHRLERAARWVHLRLGYGYRPAPMALTYAVWVLTVAGGLVLFEPPLECALPQTPAGGHTEVAPFIEAPYHYGHQLLRILLLPVGLLRLELGGAATFAPIACNAGWHMPFFAITGLLLVYFVLTLRNYLRTPKEN